MSPFRRSGQSLICWRAFKTQSWFLELLVWLILGGGFSIGWTQPDPAVDATASTNGNALTFLDSTDPFYVGVQFPKLITPQWVGEPGVDAVVILAIDDMT